MAQSHLNVIPPRDKGKVPDLLIVVPCYNEEEVLPISSDILAKTLRRIQTHGKVGTGSKILFVNDGSRDGTWDTIRGLHDADPIFCGISLAHNRGHQNALYAGLMCALDRGYDVTVSIDADLQDDVGVIEEMVDKYLDGAEIVYGVRNNRDTDTGFKRNTALAYYRFMHRLGTEVVENSADFRLMGARALEALSQYDEANLFLRGMVPALGFTTDKVYYRRGERLAGESKYPLSKMVGLAMDGITSFSTKPLELVLGLGAASLLVALVVLVVGIAKWATGTAVPEWGSLMFSVWLVGGLLLCSLGIVGEYVGKGYLEVKGRPRYVVAEEVGVCRDA